MNNLQQYSDLASIWWDDSSPFRDLLHLNTPRFAFFDLYVRSWEGKKVLDLGCGGGFVAEELARRGATVVGVDPAGQLIEVARKHAGSEALNIEYKVGSGESLPCLDQEFDVVVCVDVLEHVKNVEQVMTEVHRVLKPGGLFLYDTINKTLFSFLWMILALEWISGRIPRGTHDWRKFIRPDILREQLSRCRFQPLEQRGILMRSVSLSHNKIVPQFKLSLSRMSGLYVGAALKE